MRVTFLGTGTSYGIPMPACTCPVCTSTDPRDRRYRTSLLFTAADGFNLLLDTPPDFRSMALENAISRIDAVLISHIHADHVFGFDDLRPFSVRRPDVPIPVYASAGTAADMRRIFSYLDAPPIPGTSLARVSLSVPSGPFSVGPFRVVPLPVEHGRADMLGWRVEADARSAVVISDCKRIPPSTMALCRDADLAVLDCLRIRPHPTHFAVPETLDALRQMAPRRGYAVHLCHELSHAQATVLLAPFAPAHDRLSIDL